MTQRFASLADDFDRRIDAYTFTNKTNVRLIYICVDEQGNEIRNEIDSLTNVTVTGGGDIGAEWAMRLYKDTLHQNINSLVRNTSDGWIMLRDAPQIPLKVVNFEMFIEG